MTQVFFFFISWSKILVTWYTLYLNNWMKKISRRVLIKTKNRNQEPPMVKVDQIPGLDLTTAQQPNEKLRLVTCM